MIYAKHSECDKEALGALSHDELVEDYQNLLKDYNTDENILQYRARSQQHLESYIRVMKELADNNLYDAVKDILNIATKSIQ